jgi:hypothetical protein
MNSGRGFDLYTKTERKLHIMVEENFNTDTKVLRQFSSWAASLHLVFCDVQTMPTEYIHHVAVLDREKSEGKVLIWWVRLIFDIQQGDLEYLAHGCI